MPSLISAFHEQGLEVTAEGVETKQMAEELERLECDLLQGFYFSRALPPEDFVEYVLEQG
jgi:EAL domain-containing protein (putative c-di-GMP-specific phosphodiesterase class I)